jgi:hypothetical protein
MEPAIERRVASPDDHRVGVLEQATLAGRPWCGRRHRPGHRGADGAHPNPRLRPGGPSDCLVVAGPCRDRRAERIALRDLRPRTLRRRGGRSKGRRGGGGGARRGRNPSGRGSVGCCRSSRSAVRSATRSRCSRWAIAVRCSGSRRCSRSSHLLASPCSPGPCGPACAAPSPARSPCPKREGRPHD